jgi:type IV pilus assembly protein PilC
MLSKLMHRSPALPAPGQPLLRVGAARNAPPRKLRPLRNSQVTYVFRNLAMLIENGVSLPKALATLAEEDGTQAIRDLLLGLRKRLENGESFSAALSHYGQSFDAVLMSQVRVGERAGALGEALAGIAEQREKASKLKSTVVKKLAYPALLVVVGSGVIAFLLTYVVPVFEQTYRDAGVPLPAITQALIFVGTFARRYLWLVIIAAIVTALIIRQMRQSDTFAYRMDAGMLKIPIVGPWLRSIAILEMMEVIGDLMEAGFTLAEALAEAAAAVKNRAVKQCVVDLQRAVFAGERFSREMERHSELFPPIVSQLVIIGEQTGKLTRSTRHIRSHLQDEIEGKAEIFVGVIEPTLTMSLAAAVAVILLAIYLPMFDMINTVN